MSCPFGKPSAKTKRNRRSRSRRVGARLEPLHERVVFAGSIYIDFGFQWELNSGPQEACQGLLVKECNAPASLLSVAGLNGPSTVAYMPRSLFPLRELMDSSGNGFSYDYNGDGSATEWDARLVANHALEIVREFYAPFDVDVQLAEARTLDDVANTLAQRPTNDAYILVGDYSEPVVGARGIAPVDVDNSSDNVGPVDVSNFIALSYNDRRHQTSRQPHARVEDLATTIAHEAGHTFGLAHTEGLLEEGGIMNSDRLPGSRFMRFPARLHSNDSSVHSIQNSHDALVDVLGERDGAPAFVTGTGLHDRISVTQTGPTTAHVSVRGFSDPGYDAGSLVAAFEYDVSTTHGIVVSGLSGDDEIIADISASTTLDGGPGNDHLVGGPAADTLIGGEGDDILEGMRGDDSYVFAQLFTHNDAFDEPDLLGDDLVRDLEGNDTLDFSRVGYSYNGDVDLDDPGWQTIRYRWPAELLALGVGATPAHRLRLEAVDGGTGIEEVILPVDPQMFTETQFISKWPSISDPTKFNFHADLSVLGSADDGAGEAIELWLFYVGGADRDSETRIFVNEEVVCEEWRSVVDKLYLTGSSDGDRLVVHDRVGFPTGQEFANLPQGTPAHFNGAAGWDELVIHGTSGNDDLVVRANSVVLNGTEYSFAEVEKLTIDLGAGEATTRIESAPNVAFFELKGLDIENSLVVYGTAGYDHLEVHADFFRLNGADYQFGDVETLQVNLGGGGSTTTIHEFPDLSEGGSFAVAGGWNADDVFHVHATDLPLGTVLLDAGGIGQGELHAADRTNTWDVTGQGAGTLNGVVEFRGIRDLFGNDHNDTFDFARNARVYGVIHGAGGHDQLTLNGQESYFDNVVIDGNYVFLSPHQYDFEEIESLRIELHGGDSTTTIEAFPANTTLRLYGGAGQDSLTIDLQDVENDLFLDAERFELNGRNHEFFDMDDLRVNLGDAGSTVIVGYSLAGRLEVNGGSGRDEFVLLADDPGGNVALNGNGGDDAFHTLGLNAESRAGDVALTGGEGDDTFFFNGAGTVAGSIDGGVGHDALDFSAADSAAQVTMLAPTSLQTHRVAGGASNIDGVRGSAYFDTLVGPDDSPAFSWIISRPNGGYTADWREYAPFSFDGIENLTGGASQDLFRFYYSATLSGSIDGGAGRKDWLRYRNYSSGAAVDLTAGTATGVGESVRNIERVIGSNYDDFIRGDEHDNYLSGYSGGNDFIHGMGGNDTLYGTNGRGIMIGGSGADQVNAQADAEYMIIGGATDYDSSHHAEVLFSSLRDVWSRADLTFEERLEAVAHGTAVLTPADDGFSYVTVALNDQTIMDDEAVDTLRGPEHAMTWSITGADSGSLSNTTGDTTSAFAGIEDLIGHAADDHFLFRNNGTLRGRIDGGDGDDRLNYSADHRDVAVAILSGSSLRATGVDGGVANVEGVVGSLTGNDTLVGPDDSPQFSWMISGQNSGYVADWRNYQPFRFSAIENLTGGASQDLFRFHYSASVSGEVDGGGSNRDELRYRRYDSGVVVDLMNGAATGTGGVMNIERVLGTLHDDFIRGDDAANRLDGYHAGNDIILGMGGDDQIYGRSGANILIGGEGDDAIHGGDDEEILIAGSTIYDAAPRADAIFAAIRQAWTGGGSFEDRIETIRSGFSVAAPDEDDEDDGVAALAVALNRDTVSDESDSDQLFGESGRDWYFAALEEALEFDSADDWWD